eukprot:1190194-Prorocentrum_minimum.AAC.3
MLINKDKYSYLLGYIGTSLAIDLGTLDEPRRRSCTLDEHPPQEDAEERAKEVQRGLDRALKAADDAARYFGEDPAKMKFEKLAGILTSFCNEFTACVKQIRAEKLVVRCAHSSGYSVTWAVRSL